MIIHYSAGYEGEALNFHGMVNFPNANINNIDGNEDKILSVIKKQLIADSKRRNLNIEKIKSYEVYYFDFNAYSERLLFSWTQKHRYQE